MKESAIQLERKSFGAALVSPLGVCLLLLSIISFGTFLIIMIVIHRQFPKYVTVEAGQLVVPQSGKDHRPSIRSCEIVRVVHRTVLFFPVASVLEIRIPRSGCDKIERGRLGAKRRSYRRVDLNSVWYKGGWPALEKFMAQVAAAGIQIEGAPSTQVRPGALATN